MAVPLGLYSVQSGVESGGKKASGWKICNDSAHQIMKSMQINDLDLKT